MARVELEAQGERALAWGDAQRVTQIVANLVTNAIKHAPSGSAVRVMMHVIGVWGCVTVEDEGQGFPPEDVERMFMPFWRGPVDRTSPDRAGSGMGLTLAAFLAEAQGGRVSAVNRDRGGAWFCLELPLAEHREGERR